MIQSEQLKQCSAGQLPLNFSQQIVDLISPYRMLNHPFYQAWMQGELTQTALAKYAHQYTPFVADFPRFVSRIHSQCDNPVSRKQLLMNLNEEEGFPNGIDHPSLWEQFKNGLSIVVDDNSQSSTESISAPAQELVRVFWHYCNSSYAEGLAALYCYEQQIPLVSETKIQGLKQHYGIDSAVTTEFFSIHQQADKFHSESCAVLLDQLSEADQEKACIAAVETSKALWNFLSSCELH